MHPEIACFATQGAGSNDEARIRALLEPFAPVVLPFDRSNKLHSALRVVRAVRKGRPSLVVMEGTGLAGGLAVLTSRFAIGVPYVISSGDAIGPYVRLTAGPLAPVAALYERLLCRASAGFIGWSPYLAGRALTLGAPRAMTAAGWAPEDDSWINREEMRKALGIPLDALVFGLVGSLDWASRPGYCYGLELVSASVAVERPDVRVLIVGDGSGRHELERLAGDQLGRRVILTGLVDRDQVPSYLHAMDIASLPQSVDGVGSFRYTTKLSEYLAAGLPVVTSQVPLGYDLDDGWLWRLPGDAPWDERYIAALRRLMETLTVPELAARRSRVPRSSPVFHKERQQHQVENFIRDLVDR